MIYTTYSRATLFAPRERKLLSFVLVKAKTGEEPIVVAEGIRQATGLAAYTRAAFARLTVDYFMINTGIPLNRETANHIAVHCAGVTKSYGTGSATVTALWGIDLDVYAGELLMLVGPSGWGKTTLISVIMAAGCRHHSRENSVNQWRTAAAARTSSM